MCLGNKAELFQFLTIFVSHSEFIYSTDENLIYYSYLSCCLPDRGTANI